MSQGEILTICKDAVMTALMLAAPFLIASILIGIIISVFQAATQIHEQTITFVPKILATGALMIFLGSWLISVITSFTRHIFEYMSTMA